MSSRAWILVLVGPKGSGKTTPGRVLERKPGVCFLEVEMIAKRVLAESGGVSDEHYARRAFNAIVAEIESISNAHRVIRSSARSHRCFAPRPVRPGSRAVPESF